MMTDFSIELMRRINLQCDRTECDGETVRFYFDSAEKWKTIFQGMVGVREAVIRAYMLGFTQYIFVRNDGEEFPSSDKYWIPRDRGRLRGRSR